MLLAEIAQTSQQVAATSARRAKIELLGRCLRAAGPDEAATTVYYLSGELPQRQIGVGYAALRDLPAPAASASLTVADVDTAFTSIGAVTGKGSVARRRELLHALLAQATAAEQNFLIRLLAGELRQGALDGVLTDAVAFAAEVPPAEVRRAAMLRGALGPVATAALASGIPGLRGFGLEVGRPVKPMLAASAATLDDALATLGLTAPTAPATTPDPAFPPTSTPEAASTPIPTSDPASTPAAAPTPTPDAATTPATTPARDAATTPARKAASTPATGPTPDVASPPATGPAPDAASTSAPALAADAGSIPGAGPTSDAASAPGATMTPVAVEWKLDGIRVQAHLLSGPDGEREIRLFTRTLDDITARLPEVVRTLATLPVKSAVFDGELIALRPDGRPQPFQVTAARTATRTGKATAETLPLSVFLFDVLHLDGTDLLDQPGADRHAALASAVPAELLMPRLVTDSLDEAAEFFADAVAGGHEGVVVKSLTAPYAAGRRGAGWIKVKPRHTLDLVVLAAEWGHGRRTGKLSNLHLGARDPETGGWVMLGKTFKGLTDELLAWQTEKFQELALPPDQQGASPESGSWIVHVRPELVVEIAFDGVQRSTRYPGGMALRFARVLRYRPDKSAAEADTVDTVRALATVFD